MSIVVTDASAAALIAEGAICFNTDNQAAACDGLPVRLPSGSDEITRPVLVCGSDISTVEAVAEHLASRGLPAWQVVGTADEPLPTCCQAASGGVVGAVGAAVRAGADSRAL